MSKKKLDSKTTFIPCEAFMRNMVFIPIGVDQELTDIFRKFRIKKGN